MAPACLFSLEGLDDQRGRTDLGDIGRTRVEGEGFMEWFAAGLAALPGYTSGPSARRVRVVVLKAYVHGLGTLKSAQLVVRVHFLARLEARTYRGADATMNWSNSEGEIQSAFDRAWADLAEQIGKDLAARCDD
jgi:hypothetical protein